MSVHAVPDHVALLVRELKRPEAYPHVVDTVELRQTHASLLFFAGQRVYKVKKPVDLEFLDFTDLDRRRHFCEEEVRLNRRLAAHVYLGVVPVVRSEDGHLAVGGEGEAVEWAVEMVRLPEQRMLSSLLDRGEVDNDQMNQVAALLSDFHARAPTGQSVDEHGSPEAIRENAEQNYAQLQPFVALGERARGTRVPVLSESQLAFLRVRGVRFLEENHDLLRRRVSDGWIRDGHGDLHAENICFAGDDLVAYDCLEFSRRFRCGDVASDLAFLAMDLDHRGYPGFSGYLVKRYAKLTGDGDLRTLVPFYKGYRALVRGKVAAMTATDPGVEVARREELRCEAMRYVQLAAAYELPPALLLMCGLPACGKSWLAKRLAVTLRASVLHSDVRRKVLARIPPTHRVDAGYQAGLYSPRMKELTYRSLLDGALEGLDAGRSVIVDATFSRRAWRAPFVDAAARLGLPYFVLHVTADDRVVRERLARREHDAGEASDAGLDVYLAERAAFEPPVEVPREHLLDPVSGEGVPEEQGSTLVDRMIALQPGG